MLSRLTSTTTEDTRRPLLNDEEQIFTVDNDDDDDEVNVVQVVGRDNSTSHHDERSNESVLIDDRSVPPPLKSMVQSREIGERTSVNNTQPSFLTLNAEYDLDDDELEETSTTHLPSRRDPQTMPLLVGLIDSAQARRSSLDSPEIALIGGQGIGEEVDLEELAEKRLSGGGLLNSIANMSNSILGAGLPYAVRNAGFFMGVFLLIVLCAITDWTIRLIVVNAKMSGRTSYIAIMHHCFGESGRAAVSLFQFSMAFGGMCAFGIIIGDTIPHVILSLFPNISNIPILSLFASRQFVIAFCTITVSYPLSLYKDIHKLSRASGLALIGMSIIVISVIVEAEKVTPELRGSSSPSVRFNFITPRITEAIGVISFAFVCHHNSLLIYGGLQTPTLDRFSFVTHISTIMSLAACLTLALPAYLVFTDKTRGNILNNFSQTDTLINVARFCFGLNMFTTFPLELFVCREVIEQYFFSHEPFNQHRHVLFTTSIAFAAMFLALITCDLGVMLEITGGVSATTLAYIFPAACYIKLLPSSVPWTSRTKLPAVLCAAFGAIVMVLSLILALGKVWTREGDAKICM